MEQPGISLTQTLPPFLKEINRQLGKRSVDRILKLAVGHFRDDIALTTAFGASGMVLLHHVLKIKPDIRVHFIDTGYHFPETLEFAGMIQKKWHLNLTITRPSGRDKELGPEPYVADPDRCCAINKVEPLLSFIYEQSAWLSAIRRDQSQTRKHLRLVEIDRRGTIKISPLINWSHREIWRYIHTHKIPVNPLFAKGYSSIGCAPCTVKVGAEGHERDGRWQKSSKLECGLHDHLPHASD